MWCCLIVLYNGIAADVQGRVLFLLFVCAFVSSQCACFRLDNALADRVYELVAEQEEGEEQPEIFIEGEDPNQSSEEITMIEGKHQCITP